MLSEQVRTPDKWPKPPGKGGHTEADRRHIYSGWVSQARKELLADNFADIWKRHEEVGFIAKCNGSEERKIILYFLTQKEFRL